MVGPEAARQQAQSKLEVGNGRAPHCPDGVVDLGLGKEWPIEPQHRPVMRDLSGGAELLCGSKSECVEPAREVMLGT